jgi:hypothetical protein
MVGQTIVFCGQSSPGLVKSSGRVQVARGRRPAGAIDSLRGRLDGCFTEMADIARSLCDAGEQAGLRDLVEHSRKRVDVIPVAAK